MAILVAFKTVSIIYCLWFHVFNSSFFFGCAGSSLLHLGFLQVCRRELLFVVVHGLLLVMASPGWHRLQGAPAHRWTGLAAPQPVKSSQIQRLNPCPLHWQADSYPLHHQGSPLFSYPKWPRVDCMPFTRKEKTLLLRCFYFTVSFHKNLIMPTLLSEKLQWF